MTTEDPEELIKILNEQLVPLMSEREKDELQAYFKLDEQKNKGYENTQRYIKRMILKYLETSPQ